MAVPVSLRLSRVVFCFLRVLCALCGFPSPCPPWFAFSGLLTPEISPAREDFHAATGASCRRGPNRHRCLVAALPRCGARSSRGAGSFCGAGFLACGRFSSRPGRPLPTALNPTESAPGGASRPACHAGSPVPAGGSEAFLSQTLWGMPPGLRATFLPVWAPFTHRPAANDPSPRHGAGQARGGSLQNSFSRRLTHVRTYLHTLS